MRKLARNIKVSSCTLRKAVHSDLESNLYVRTPKHFLTPTMKAIRLERTENVELPLANLRLKFFLMKKYSPLILF